MKFLRYIASLFIPNKMGLRRNISVFVSIAILLIASLLIAIPYMSKFEKMAYEVYCDYESYDFRVLDSVCSIEVEFTEEEQNEFSSNYNLITFEQLKAIDFKVENGKIVMPKDAKTYKDIEYNGKEYLLKRKVYNYDSDGTKLDETDIYYIHIVFDIFDELKDKTYIYSDSFDKKLNLADEKHFLFVFYIDGFCYRNEYMVDKNRVSYGFSYNDVDLSFAEMEHIDYITRKISDMLIPETKTQYTYNSFIYAVVAPFVIALAFYALIRRKTVLVKFKHYFNIIALCSIPVMILFFALEWSDLAIRLGIIDVYWPTLAIYYFIVVRIINKNQLIVNTDTVK